MSDNRIIRVLWILLIVILSISRAFSSVSPSSSTSSTINALRLGGNSSSVPLSLSSSSSSVELSSSSRGSTVPRSSSSSSSILAVSSRSSSSIVALSSRNNSSIVARGSSSIISSVSLRLNSSKSTVSPSSSSSSLIALQSSSGNDSVVPQSSSRGGLIVTLRSSSSRSNVSPIPSSTITIFSQISSNRSLSRSYTIVLQSLSSSITVVSDSSSGSSSIDTMVSLSGSFIFPQSSSSSNSNSSNSIVVLSSDISSSVVALSSSSSSSIVALSSDSSSSIVALSSISNSSSVSSSSSSNPPITPISSSRSFIVAPSSSSSSSTVAPSSSGSSSTLSLTLSSSSAKVALISSSSSSIIAPSSSSSSSTVSLTSNSSNSIVALSSTSSSSTVPQMFNSRSSIVALSSSGSRSPVSLSSSSSSSIFILSSSSSGSNVAPSRSSSSSSIVALSSSSSSVNVPQTFSSSSTEALSSRGSRSPVSSSSSSSNSIFTLSSSSSSSIVASNSSSSSSIVAPSSSGSSSALSLSSSSSSPRVAMISSSSTSIVASSSSSSSSTVSLTSSSKSFMVALSSSSSNSTVPQTFSSSSYIFTLSSSSSSSSIAILLSSSRSTVALTLSSSSSIVLLSSNRSSSIVVPISSSSSSTISLTSSSNSPIVALSSSSSSSIVAPSSSSFFEALTSSSSSFSVLRSSSRISSSVALGSGSSSSVVSLSSSRSSSSVSGSGSRVLPSSSSSFSSSLVYSISPTSSSQIIPTTTPAATTTPIASNLYPYGPNQNDNELRLEDTSSYSARCLRINTDWTGFPFFTERHYKLYICRNGIIQLNYEWSWWWPRKFGIYWWLRNMSIIAPFWATTDTYFAFKNGHSKVYYQVYSQTKETSNEILDMASKHVQSYTGGFGDFEATWVLVVTWENLCPYVYHSHYYYYQNINEQDFLLNCPRSNTFQAVLITNGFNAFLMYNYPYGGIQWVIDADPNYYRYWTDSYGLPVAGWNAGNDGKDYINVKGSGTFGMYDLDKKEGNTGLLGRHFWRIENSNGQGALEKCFSWVILNEYGGFRYWYDRLIKSDREMACPCTAWQAWFDRGRFRWNWRNSWPDWCFESRRSRFHLLYTRRTGLIGVRMTQQCCYSTQWEDWASLKQGPPDGGRVQVTVFYYWYNKVQTFYTDEQAYQYCCVDIPFCHLFYDYRPSDSCSLYRPPIRRWFWGDPHIKTLDGGNYTFNGLGEYTMVDAQNGTFQLQARTKLAQGNSTTATIFSAGAAKEENSSTIEVRVKDGGGFDIMIDNAPFHGYHNLTNRTVEVGGNISVSIPEENCLQVSFPSTSSVQFCERKEMMSFVVTLADVLKNATKGLLGTWNDNPNDDFTLPNGMVLPSSSSLKDIHYGFGIKWQITHSQSLFTYADNESVANYSDPNFEPMFADNITWHNESLRQIAEAECGDDHECLFDVASTNDLSVGLVTKDISVQLVNESNTLENFPPKIVNSSNVINATLNETVELSITAVDEGTITFQVINKPVRATWNQTGNKLSFYWPVASSQKFNMTFVAIDDKGASTSWIPTVRMCACQHDGQCVEPEKGDTANTDNKFVYMGCACQGGYTGRFCDSDIDACEMNGQPCYTGVECTDLPAPANSSGYKCGPCPSGYTGDGAQCVDYDECQSSSLNNCEQICVNIPASFFCECRDGYALNDDGRRCDDVDECNPSSDCMQTCINSVGSYNCSCDEFFKTDPSDWRKCVATNPCSADHGCEHVCFMGSSGEAGCACFANFELDSDGKKCIDVNECDPAKKLHRCDQICTNTPGSYNCSCEKGFELKKDGYECEDINECLNDDLFNCADEFHKCVNTRGSYKCECEQDLYFIDGKCRGLEKNETAPLPDLPEPRVPSESEKQEAVRFSIPSGVEWDFNKDKSFKEKLASVTTEFCSQNRTTCALKETRRKRRSPLFDLYTADQVHLLPGYPINSSDSLQVAFYVQQPAGLFVGNISVLPRDALVFIIKLYKPQIEKGIGANISDIETLFETSPSKEYPTVGPQEPGNNGSKWTVIGISVGLFVLIVAIIYIVLVSFTLRTKGKSARKTESYHYPEDGINMTSF